MRGNNTANSNQGRVLSSNDHDNHREEALSIGLNFAATLVQVIYQRQGNSPNLVSIIAIVVSFCACLGYRHLSHTFSISATLTSSIALFSASLAMASVIAIPLHGIILKCIPYAICNFPLFSLLSVLYSCWQGPDSDPNTNLPSGSNQPSPGASTIDMEMAAPPQEASRTIDIPEGIDETVADGEKQAPVADDHEAMFLYSGLERPLLNFTGHQAQE